MGQQEVYNFLLKHDKGWYTSKEISKFIGCSIGSVTTCLKKLRKTKYIKFKTHPEHKNTYLYQISK